MAVNLDNTTKDDVMTAIRDRCANGTLQILAGATVLASFGLSTSGGTISSQAWTLVLDASTVAAVASGTATVARIRDSGGTDRITGLTVGTSGTDVVLDSTAISSGGNVTISSAVITHA